MTVTITAAAVKVKFKDVCLSLHTVVSLLTIDAFNYWKYIGNGSTYGSKTFATQLTVTQYIEIYISSVLAKKWK